MTGKDVHLKVRAMFHLKYNSCRFRSKSIGHNTGFSMVNAVGTSLYDEYVG
jgi:hypothetical protein